MMKIEKALRPNGILIEVWKCMGDNSLSWLTKLFNKIIKGKKKMADEWRKSVGPHLQEQGGSWDQTHEPHQYQKNS